MKRHPITNHLRSTTTSIVKSYGESGVPAHHLDPDRKIPSREVIVRILDRLFAVLYPGFYGVPHLTGENVEFHVGALLDDIAADLFEQACLSYQLENGHDDGSAEAIARRAEAAVQTFFERLPELRRILVLDIQAAMDGDPAARSFAEIIFAYPGHLAITVNRIAHELFEIGVPLLPRIMTEYAHGRTGIDIHPGAKIGESFFIDHGTGVVIGETAEIGNGVKIYQGVTLGALSFPKDERGRVLKGFKRHPTLEDNVVIYAGSTILGGDTVIGAGAVIGGNSWVTESVAPGAKIMNMQRSNRNEPRT